jgi:hypothetical protein
MADLNFSLIIMEILRKPARNMKMNSPSQARGLNLGLDCSICHMYSTKMTVGHSYLNR